MVSYLRENSCLIFPFSRHEDVEGEKRYSSSYSLTRQYVQVSGEVYVPSNLGVEFTTGLEVLEK